MVIGQYSNAGAFFTITVAPTPPAAPTGVLALAGNGQATISWSAVSGASSYNLYYSQTSGAGTGGTKIASVTSPYVHSGRTNGVPYYYVVTAVKSGLESTASSQVSATPVAALLPPQTFNFDDGTLQGWSATGAWGLTSAVTYSSSSFAVTDSPAGSYSNSSNTSITSPVFDLTSAGSPALSFYHQYSIEDFFDEAYVEVSTDGGVTFNNITPGVQYYSGYLPTFTKVTIDLSSYKTNAVVIRFRLTSDFSGAYDGWYIDDIVVQ
jgi:bacillopeptidase F